MGQIINTEQIPTIIKQLKDRNKKIVLVGGCFDILHAAHIEFLKKASKHGDILVVMLESDKRIHKLKGKNRPINSQNNRAAVLSNLPFVNYILQLEDLKTDKDYEMLVKLVKPDIIAVTVGNPVFDWERKYTNETGSKIVEVMDRKENYSTTRIAQKIKL